ncbi:MAG TPA: hypothetical protein DCQ06_02720, partial [Myxococcales bacterium]|nr:hypothetical protein [Myxococcales bacterium]
MSSFRLRWLVVLTAIAIGCSTEPDASGEDSISFGVDTSGKADAAIDSSIAPDTQPAVDTASAEDTSSATDTNVEPADTSEFDVVDEDSAVEPDTSVADTAVADVPIDPKSCVGRCGKYKFGAVCQCHTECMVSNDCCTDYAAICQGQVSDGGANDAVSGDSGGAADSGPADTTPITDIGCQKVDPGLPAGSLVISEVMINPKAVFDDFGEWVEIHNPGNTPIPLDGVSIVEPVLGKTHTITGCTLFIPPQGYFVVGPTANKLQNGGIEVDYAYNIGTLQNVNGAVEIRVGATLIDKVSWPLGIWPSPSEFDGKAASLDPTKLDATKNDKYPFTWCPSPQVMGNGDYGTPGQANPVCPKPPDDDGDEIENKNDNCPNAQNSDQADGDKDGVGD